MPPDLLDLTLRGAHVLVPAGLRRLDVGVRDGRIAALTEPGGPVAARTILELHDLVILPGAIDIHFHVRAPANPERGTFLTETRAAAAGGVTTILEMPVSRPACRNAGILDDRRSLGEREAIVDFGLYGAPATGDPADAAGLAAAGAVAFKIFTIDPPRGREDEFKGICATGTGELIDALEAAAATGLVLSVHCEDQGVIDRHAGRLRAAGRLDPRAHAEARPPIAETLAIARLLELNHHAGARLHIAHLSTARGLELVRAARAAGQDVTAETCPHYLLFTADELDRHGNYAKINPPLRGARDQAALWEGLQDGSILAVTTDHAPFTAAEKDAGDIWSAPPGAPGVEILLPVMLDAAARGRLSLERAVELVTRAGAERLGLRPQKGVIENGADADLVVVDLAGETRVERAGLFTQARDCDRLYDGRVFRGRIERTLVRGETVFEAGRVTGKPGHGRFVRPAASGR